MNPGRGQQLKNSGYSPVSQISYLYAFNLMPDLKVTIGFKKGVTHPKLYCNVCGKEFEEYWTRMNHSYSHLI